MYSRPPKNWTACDARILCLHDARELALSATVGMRLLARLTAWQTVLQLRRSCASPATDRLCYVGALTRLLHLVEACRHAQLDAPDSCKSVLRAPASAGTGQGSRSLRALWEHQRGSTRPSALPEVLVRSNPGALWRDDPPNIAVDTPITKLNAAGRRNSGITARAPSRLGDLQHSQLRARRYVASAISSIAWTIQSAAVEAFPRAPDD